MEPSGTPLPPASPRRPQALMIGLVALAVIIIAGLAYWYLPAVKGYMQKPATQETQAKPVIYVSGIENGQTVGGVYRVDPASGALSSEPLLPAEETTGRYQAVLSPDGSEVAYVSRAADADPRIFVAPVGGGEAKLVPTPSNSQTIFYPVWSPDGKKLAYATLAADTDVSDHETWTFAEPWTVYETNLADGATRTVATSAFNPIYGPDGSLLYLNASGLHTTSSTTVSAIWGMASGTPRAVSRVTLSPDRNTIAWINPDTSAVLIGTITWGAVPQISAIREISGIRADSGTFSPDGKQLAVVEIDWQNGEDYTLAVLDVATGDKLLEKPLPFWSTVYATDWR